MFSLSSPVTTFEESLDSLEAVVQVPCRLEELKECRLLGCYAVRLL
jgi:hypothetical protein